MSYNGQEYKETRGADAGIRIEALNNNNDDEEILALVGRLAQRVAQVENKHNLIESTLQELVTLLK